MRTNDSYISVKETCAFDSLVQLIMHACGKENKYKEELQTIKNNLFIELCLNILNRGKIVSANYNKRAIILKNTHICKYTATRHMEFLNANCNMDHLIEIIFTNLLPSIIRKNICHQCNYSSYRNFATLHINIDILLTEDLGKIQESINDTLFKEINKNCSQCNSILTQNYECSSHIFLDTSIITHLNYKIEHRESSTLDVITKLINVDDRDYVLCGIINYMSYNHKSKRDGHYTAITFTGMHWYEYDNLKKTRSFVSPEKIVTPHTIMYIIKT